MIGLLDPDATLTTDSGGRVSAVLRPIRGGDQIARHLVNLARHAPSNVAILERTVNGQPGLVGQQDGKTVTVFAFEVAADRIRRIWAMRNPDKLRLWTIASREELGTKQDRFLPGPWPITTTEDSVMTRQSAPALKRSKVSRSLRMTNNGGRRWTTVCGTSCLSWKPQRLVPPRSRCFRQRYENCWNFGQCRPRWSR